MRSHQMPTAYRIDLQTERSIRQIVAAMLVLYRRFPLLFTILALAVVAPYDLAFLGITGYGPLARIAYHDKALSLSLLNSFLRDFLVIALISALHVHAVNAIGDGQRPRLKAVALRGIKVLPVVAATEVITYVGTLVGFIFLIVPGFLLALRWAVSAQAAALERQGPSAAIDSSRQLTAGHYWHILGLQLLFGALATGVDLGARVIAPGGTSGVASVCVGIAVQTIVASFSALSLALLYFDLRARALSHRVCTPALLAAELGHEVEQGGA
jgi:hypothetical protein